METVVKIYIAKYGENANRSFGFRHDTETNKQIIRFTSNPVGFGYFLGFLKITTK